MIMSQPVFVSILMTEVSNTVKTEYQEKEEKTNGGEEEKMKKGKEWLYKECFAIYTKV